MPFTSHHKKMLRNRNEEAFRLRADRSLGGYLRSQASSSDCAARKRLAFVSASLPAGLLGICGDVEAAEERRALETR